MLQCTWTVESNGLPRGGLQRLKIFCGQKLTDVSGRVCYSQCFVSVFFVLKKQAWIVLNKITAATGGGNYCLSTLFQCHNQLICETLCVSQAFYLTIAMVVHRTAAIFACHGDGPDIKFFKNSGS